MSGSSAAGDKFKTAFCCAATVTAGGLAWSLPSQPSIGLLTDASTLQVSSPSASTPVVAPTPATMNTLRLSQIFLGTALAACLARRKQRQNTLRSQKRVVRLAYESMCKETDAPDSMRRRFEAVIAAAQDHICKTIEDFDGGAKFSNERYGREKGGGGVARVLKDGNVFEKAGVNLSVVYGEMPQDALRAANDRGVDRAGVKLEPGQKVPFYACGLSSVMHPRNPFCPTMHFNYRYFETEFGTWWFGGGTDITPSYLDRNDMKHFHGTYKQVCDKYDKDWYPKFKEWADKYFYISHRGETRGLGGIFFDDFNSEDPETHLSFSKECLQAVTDAYVPVLANNRDKKFTDEQKDWQQMRRGRYVEFNLVYDRGTIFGLKMLPTGTGRIESILMSLPETARWEYCHEPQPGTPEAEIMEAYKHPQEWV